MHIYIAKNGTKTGPYSEEQVRGMLTGGLVSVDDSAWHEGAADWQPLHILLGLKQPPPIPTAAPSVVAQPKQIIGQPPQLLTRMPIPVQDAPEGSFNHPSSHNTNPTEPKQTWSEIIARLQPGSPSVKTQPKQATSSQATAPVKVGGWLLWAISLALVCFGLLTYSYFYTNNATSDLVFLFGYNFSIGSLIWGVFYAAFNNATGRNQGNKKAGLAFLAIIASLVGGDLLSYSQRENTERQAAGEIKKAFSSLTESAFDAQGRPQRIEEKLDVNPKTKGAVGEVERFMKSFINKATSQRNDYLLELSAIGWDKILDAERIKQDKGLIESEVIIEKGKDIVRKYRAKSYALLENSRRDISNLNVSAGVKREMENGFDRGMANSRSQFDAQWDLEAKILSEFENIFALLNSRKGAWVIENGKILFTSGSNLKEFNSYLALIQGAVDKQEAIRKQKIGDVNSLLDGLQN